jgi:transposase
MRILAIDLGKFKSVACLFDTETNETQYHTLASSAGYLRSFLPVVSADRVVFEACSLAGWVHDLCVELGFEVLVCNPNQEAWKWKNVKRKTDKDDSLKLARLAALGQLVPVHIPGRETRGYRRLVKYRKTLVGRVNRIQNNIRALLVQQGCSAPVGQRAWTAAGLEALGKLRRPLAECRLHELWRGELDLELTALEQAWAQLKAADVRLEQLAAEDERVQLLQTIPGVGRKTAEVIATQLDRPERFRNARQVSAYAGLVPRRFQSGNMDRQGGITRRGSRLLRSSLVECAWVMLRYNSWARAHYERIHAGQKTRKKQAIIAVARKLLVRSWAMLRDRTAWNGPAEEELPPVAECAA